MIEIDCVTFDDKEYAIIETAKYNNIEYVYLVNTNDENDMMIKKLIIENNEEYYYSLDSDEEFDNVITLFEEKLSNK